MQLDNLTLLFDEIDRHRPQLQRVVNAGRKLLQRWDSLPRHRRSWQANVGDELTRLDAMWRELETTVHQQRERLATDPERQVDLTLYHIYDNS